MLSTMYNLDRLKPVVTADLVRLGHNLDGGYVLNERVIHLTDQLITFGISNEWSFESDFFNRKKGTPFCIDAYDYSVSTATFLSESLSCFKRAVFGGKGFEYIRYGLFQLKTAMQFNTFFGKSNIKFYQQGIADAIGGVFIDFHSVIQNAMLHRDRKNIFVKMDIEGYEFSVIPRMLDYKHQFIGFAIEFHELDLNGERFDENIRQIFDAGYVITHVHPNNWGGCIPDSNHPRFLEITFAKKELFTASELSIENTLNYPLPNLDYRCIPSKPEVSLTFAKPK